MTTEVNHQTTNTHPELTRLTLEALRDLGKHHGLTGGDYYLSYDHEYEYYCRDDLRGIASLLNENPHIDGSFEMLIEAEKIAREFTEDIHDHRRTQGTEAETMMDVLASYRVIAERLQLETAWVDEIEAEWRNGE